MQSALHKRALIFIFGLIVVEMNFLAHSILSPDLPLVMLGNLSGDFVKGSKFNGIHDDIAKGVKIHRAIDHYTDHHVNVKEAKKLVKMDFGLFSGVVIDMFFDHFVAVQHTNLNAHVTYVYHEANIHFELLPQKFKHVFPYMEKYNWLEAYAELANLRKIMWQMRQRIGDKSPLDKAVDILISNTVDFQELFQEFWVDINKEFSF